MKPEAILEKFDLFADAPEAVAKMRELVLHLGFSGKLLAAAEPWPLESLKSLTTKIGSGATPAGGRESYFTEGTPLIRSMNIHFAGFEKKGLVFLSDEQAAQLANVTVQPSDVLLNITGASIGRVTTAPPEMAGARVNQHVAIIRPTKELDARFLAKFLASPAIQRMIDDVQVGATREALTKGMIEQFQIPLPPLAEQERIVVKVDELMSLCDQLEAQQEERETRHAALARAALATFANTPNPANLELLFHMSYSIPPADLRKSILTLAVQGKLVPQDPKDERPLVTRAGLFDELFEVPENWEWIQLGDLEPEFQNGASSRGDRDGTSVVVIRLADIESRRIVLDDPRAVTVASEQISKYRLQVGDTLLTRVNGSADIVGTFIPVQCALDAIYCDHFIRMRIDPERLLPAYTALVGETQLVRDQIKSLFITTAGQKTVNQSHIRSLSVPLPPLAEQRRIVARVDQLMAFVGALETQLATARTTSATLVEAVVAELTAAA